MEELKTDFKNDTLDGNRKYQMINNSDGTVSFVDVTQYTQKGDTFGANEINTTNEAINQLNSNLTKIGTMNKVLAVNFEAKTLLNVTLSDSYKKYREIVVVMCTYGTAFALMKPCIIPSCIISNITNQFCECFFHQGNSSVAYSVLQYGFLNETTFTVTYAENSNPAYKVGISIYGVI